MTSVPETAPQDAVLRYSNTAVALHTRIRQSA